MGLMLPYQCVWYVFLYAAGFQRGPKVRTERCLVVCRYSVLGGLCVDSAGGWAEGVLLVCLAGVGAAGASALILAKPPHWGGGGGAAMPFH